MWVSAAALVVAAWLSLAVGAADLTVADLIHPDERTWLLLRVSRLPRVVSIVLAGAALSVAGLIMQRIVRNRFVSPSTSGTVESAVLGILVATVLFAGASLVTKMLFAIACAILGTFGFVALVKRVRHSDGIVVALLGIMYGGVIMAVATFIAFQRDLIQLLDIWTTGSFSGVLEGRYEPIYAVLVVGLVGYLYADRFTVIGMGEAFATNLGVAYRRTLNIGLVVVSLIAAVVVVVVGAIPFLGLIVPNVVSLLLGDNLRRVLPVTALAGGAFVLLCDVIGRLIRHPYEIPASTIAGVIGGVVFVILVLRSAHGARP